MSQDQWAQWLLQKRHGGDEARFQLVMHYLTPIRDKLLENARLRGDETLLDVGCGDGLISFTALEKLPQGKVIFSDISQDLLDHVKPLAEQMGVGERCSFVQANAADLAAIPDRSVDVVTLRSVLIYVKDKQAALQSFFRVLKPGGRLSLFEPINRFNHPEPPNRFWGNDITPVQELADKLKAYYRGLQPDDDPMVDFDERDLLRMAEGLGFREIDMEYQAKISPIVNNGITWESFIQLAPNPLVPGLGVAMNEALSEEERARFTDYFRPLVERDQGVYRQALVYLWATKG